MTRNGQRLLMLIDDEPAQRRLVAAIAARRQWRTVHANDSEAALAILDTNDGACLDAIVIDSRAPDYDVAELIGVLRGHRPNMPILILTAQSGIEDRVAALDEGADDYLVKPFDLRELHARVRALARRTGSDRGGAVTYADLVFDPAGRILTIDGVPAGLTRRETTLFEVLLANRDD